MARRSGWTARTRDRTTENRPGLPSTPPRSATEGMASVGLCRGSSARTSGHGRPRGVACACCGYRGYGLCRPVPRVQRENLGPRTPTRRRLCVLRQIGDQLDPGVAPGCQAPGATQRCLNPGCSERIGNSRRTPVVWLLRRVQRSAGHAAPLAAGIHATTPQRMPRPLPCYRVHPVGPTAGPRGPQLQEPSGFQTNGLTIVRPSTRCPA